MKRTILLRWLLLVSTFWAGTAEATTLDFTYSGLQETEGYTAVGSGSISYATGLTSIAQSDLTAFSFVETTDFQGYNPVGPPNYGTLSFALADISSFELAVSPGNVPTAFTMTATAPGPSSYENTFTVYGGSGSFVGVLGPAIAGDVTFGQSAAPEPGSAALCVLSVLLVGFAGRRRRPA